MLGLRAPGTSPCCRHIGRPCTLWREAAVLLNVDLERFDAWPGMVDVKFTRLWPAPASTHERL